MYAGNRKLRKREKKVMRKMKGKANNPHKFQMWNFPAVPLPLRLEEIGMFHGVWCFRNGAELSALVDE